MERSSKEVKNFYDLFVWQESHRFVVKIYVITKTFPQEELYGLTSQMRRASVSITSNIAEGYGRAGINEKIKFYRTAQASLLEVQSQLFICRDVGYISSEKFQDLFSDSQSVVKLLSLFIAGFKRKTG